MQKPVNLIQHTFTETKETRKRQGRAHDKGNEKASAHVSMYRETNKRDKRS